MTDTRITSAGFVVYQSGYAIFGYGDTVAAAITEANKWVDPQESLTANDVLSSRGLREIDGQMYSMPATAALIDQVKTSGGEVAWGSVDGIACTVAQEDASFA
jgi:hypothetical protein